MARTKTQIGELMTDAQRQARTDSLEEWIAKLQADLPTQLECLTQMTSCERRQNSYGQYEAFSKSTIKDHNNKNKWNQDEIDSLRSGKINYQSLIIIVDITPFFCKFFTLF
jgi:hypothetical protein